MHVETHATDVKVVPVHVKADVVNALDVPALVLVNVRINVMLLVPALVLVNVRINVMPLVLALVAAVVLSDVVVVVVLRDVEVIALEQISYQLRVALVKAGLLILG